jgi:hypothetical protein
MRPFKIRSATASVRLESLDKVSEARSVKRYRKKEVGRVAENRYKTLLENFIPEKIQPAFASF